MCEAGVKFFRQLLVIPAAISIAVPVAAQINLEKDNLKIKQPQIGQDISSDGYLIADSNSGNIKDDSDSLEITVTGTRNEKFVDDVPSSIDVIDLSDEKYSGFSELKDLFKYETGVSVEVDSYIPYSAASAVEGNVNIRGMVDNRVLFTQDGIRLPNAFGYSAPLAYNYDRGSFVDFNTIKTVEIVKGPGSTLFGSDALGGILSYRSLQASDLLKTGEDFAIEIPTSYTSHTKGKNGAIKIAARDKNLGTSAVAVYSYLNSEEYLPKDFTDRAKWINDVERTGSTFFINAEKEAGENKKFGLILERVQRDTESTKPANTLTSYGPTLSYTKQSQDVDVTKDRIVLSYSYDNAEKVSGFNSFIAKGYYQNAETDDIWDDNRLSGFARTPQLRISDYQLKDESYGADIQFGSKINDHNLTYGIEASTTDNSYLQERWTTNLLTGVVTPDHKKRVPDGETKRIGVYLQDEVRIGKVDVTAGVRFENTKIDVETDAIHTKYCSGGGAYTCLLGELDVNALTPKIGAIYDVSPNVAFYGQYAAGFRVPTWEEMNAYQVNLFASRYGQPYQIRPNPDVEPEKSNSFEIGLRGKTERNKFRLATFINKYEDLIGSTSLGKQTVDNVPNVNVSKIDNVGKATIWGVELNNDFKLTENKNGKISLINSVSYLKGEDDEANEPLDDIDPFKVVTGFQFSNPTDTFNAELIATYVGVARLPESDTYYKPDAYTVFDLIGAYQATDSLKLDIGIYNLADKRYYNYQNTRTVRPTTTAIERYSQPGRSLKAGFKYRF